MPAITTTLLVFWELGLVARYRPTAPEAIEEIPRDPGIASLRQGLDAYMAHTLN